FEQEAHEVLREYWLDLGAQALHRVAVDAREQAAVAPFLVECAWREATAHREAFGLQGCQRKVDLRMADAKPGRECRDWDWAKRFESTADELDKRGFLRPRLRVLGRGAHVRFEARIREQGLELRPTLGGNPKARRSARPLSFGAKRRGGRCSFVGKRQS